MLASLSIAPFRSAEAQDDAAVQKRVRRDLHGTDLQGKDGPMAHVHTALVELYHRRRLQNKQERGIRRDVPSVHLVSGGVAVEAVATEPAELLRALVGLGLQNGARAGRLVSGVLPIEAIDDAASLSPLRTLRPSLWTTAIGSTTAQGDSALKAGVARASVGTNGNGVKVCVLSNSYNTDPDADSTAADDVASGDLPGEGNPNGFTTPVDVREDLEEDSDTDVSDEGRAMLQVVHDLAPGATLGFHTAFGGQANFENGIRTLAGDANCGVLVDDVRYFAQPMFQDGVIAQAVTDVVDDGATFFSAVGNYADRSYDTAEDDTPNRGFIDSGRDGSSEPASGLSGDLHDFDDSEDGIDVYQQITALRGETVSMSLQWDNPFASACSVVNPCAADEDLDLFLLNAAADTVLASSQTRNLSSDPVEIIQFTNDSGEDQVYNLAITRQFGAPDRIKYIILNDRVTIDEFDTRSSTVFGHPNADGAASVGTVFWHDTPVFQDVEPVLRSISSKGGTPILFDTQGDRLASPEERRSPDFAAIDGVNNTFFGGDIPADSDAFPNFFGTSAAAPHAGAIAALMRSVDPSLMPNEVYQSLEDSAIDLTERFNTSRSQRLPIGEGYDRFSGAGLLQAPNAAPLPVEFTRFTRTARGDAAVLSWRTASETNNAGFRIEHQPPGATAWKDRDVFVEGAGTTTRPQSYHVRIDDLVPGSHRFRLRQIDLDGTAARSDAVTVTVALDERFRLVATGPNPVRDATTFRLTVQRSQRVQAAVFNTLGQRVKVVHEGRVAADTPIPLRIDSRTLANGVYFLRVQGEGFKATRTIFRIR